MAPQMKMSGSAPAGRYNGSKIWEPFDSTVQRLFSIVFTNIIGPAPISQYAKGQGTTF